ncbi:MAG: 2-amino-4-hydroxy-6-hydroxymethyldihydropteridine diphosphokinase [Acidobacteriota bacterium]|nr:2-amino-4-hydroxy-6-hydroxymethyldihydropteridine diphosphokinase [Blastocatellia bacterium]MDW8412453.1 2-amino-4-hydroxy-6-hydroxymethyldihydropteridine diphosphokinase [Acidobacteriota bacterium]
MTKLKRQAIVGLGSNCGDRAGYLLAAISEMMALGLKIERLSAIYETEPVDYIDQPSFLNMAALIGGRMPSPEKLLLMLLELESRLGRSRSVPKGPRTIDLDLLVYGDVVISDRQAELEIPHPRMHLRRFVMVPVVDVCPHGIHPVLGRSFEQILFTLPLSPRVVKYRL